MRIAFKSTTGSSETPQATGTKSSGESFLDILSQGSVQAAKGSSSQAQGESDAQAQSFVKDQKSAQANASPNTNQDLNGATAVSASRSAKTAAADGAINEQGTLTTGQQNTQATAGDGAPKTAALLAPVDLLSAQSILNAQMTLQLSQGSGKQAAQSTSGAPAKTAAAKPSLDSSPAARADGSLVAVLTASPTPVLTLPERAGALQEPTNSKQQVDPPSVITAQAYTHAGQQAASAQPSSATLQTTTGQQDANQQTTTSIVSLEKNLAESVAIAAQANQPVQATHDSNSVKAPNPAAATLSGSTNEPANNTFLSAAILPNGFDAIQLASKAGQLKASSANFAANAETASTTNAIASSTTTGTTTSASPSKTSSQDSASSSHATQGSGDATQSGSTQTATVDARPVDATLASQAIAQGTLAGAHQATQTGSAPAATSAATDATPRHASESGNLPAEGSNATFPGGASGINSARLIQTMNETEMRVGMRSSEFGDISIRTMVTQQQMQAQISVDHGELVSALSAHIPSIQAKLGNDYGLHASIEVSQNGASFSGDRGQSPSQKDYKPFVPSMQIDATTPVAETGSLTLRPTTSLIEGSRLDIRA